MDGARLDEFVFSSGTSTFCKFLDAGALRHCRQLVPVFSTAVHQGSIKGETRYDAAHNDDYMVKMMDAVIPLLKLQGIASTLTSSMSQCHTNGVSLVRLKAYAILGDYPGMCRYVNTRGGKCPFCWFGRGAFGEQSLKTATQERERLIRCKEQVCSCNIAIAVMLQCIMHQFNDLAVVAAEKFHDIRSLDNPFLMDVNVDIFSVLGIDLMHTLYERFYSHFWDMIRYMLNGRGKVYSNYVYCSKRYAEIYMQIISIE